MSKRSSPLDHVSIAAPCNSAWGEMIGNGQVRFCGQCQLNVYNLSGMTKSAAERVIANTEGRLCVRYYRRADGTVLTKNCPVGLRAIRRRISRIAVASASIVLSFFAGVLSVVGVRGRVLNRVRAAQARIEFDSRFTPLPVVGQMLEPEFKGGMILGDYVRDGIRVTLPPHRLRR